MGELHSVDAHARRASLKLRADRYNAKTIAHRVLDDHEVLPCSEIRGVFEFVLKATVRFNGSRLVDPLQVLAEDPDLHTLSRVALSRSSDLQVVTLRNNCTA